MGEAVGVADDELVEGQLGIAERTAVCWVRPHASPMAAITGAREARGCGPRRRSGRWRPDELGDCVLAEHQCDTVLDDPAEAVLNPALGVRRSLDQQPLPVELEGPKRSQPDAVCGLVYGERELGLHP